MEYEKVTEAVIGCAYRVYNKMGFGFLESVYEKCMLIELRKAGLSVEAQKPISVYYDDQPVGNSSRISLWTGQSFLSSNPLDVLYSPMKSNWSTTWSPQENL